MQNENMNPVTWFEIYVDDMARAKAFYETVLEIKLEALPAPEGTPIEMQAFPMINGASGAAGALVKMEGYCSTGGGTIVYFESEDCALEEARIEAAGGKVMKSKASIGEYGFMVIGSDTEGNPFGVHSMK